VGAYLLTSQDEYHTAINKVLHESKVELTTKYIKHLGYTIPVGVPFIMVKINGLTERLGLIEVGKRKRYQLDEVLADPLLLELYLNTLGTSNLIARCEHIDIDFPKKEGVVLPPRLMSHCYIIRQYREGWAIKNPGQDPVFLKDSEAARRLLRPMFHMTLYAWFNTGKKMLNNNYSNMKEGYARTGESPITALSNQD
jgi:hypothetical protein